MLSLGIGSTPYAQDQIMWQTNCCSKLKKTPENNLGTIELIVSRKSFFISNFA
jgi:hypothetical protein